MERYIPKKGESRMQTYLEGEVVEEIFLCRKCDEVEVEDEGDLCGGCATHKGGGNDPETAKEE